MAKLKGNQKQPEVLYIMGTARSGSTVLEILLSHARNTYGAGEMTTLLQDGFIGNKNCSCGQPCRSCNVWSKVLAETDLDNLQLKKLAIAQKQLDWHSGFFRQLLAIVPRHEKENYQKFNRELIDSIKNVTQALTIIDSSKYAGRALALVNIVKSDVKIICLTRSPIGLLTSFQKPNQEEQLPKKPFSVILYYLTVLTTFWLARMLFGKKQLMALRFEDLIHNPEEVMLTIENWSGLDLTAVKQGLKSNTMFSVGHLISGNLLRKQGKVQLKREINSRPLKSIKIKTAVAVMNFWRWLLKF